jgi:hypothetical protein
MKAKLYILTFNNEQHLNDGLRSLFAADLSQHELDVYIINNNTRFILHEEFKDKVTVLHNVMQPDFGTGHTSRNWNQGLMHGFKDLNNPDCDLVILAQDDTHYHYDWINVLHRIHFEQGYHFFSIGAGDMLHSYTPIAVKKVGLWDERFGAICFMEHDYFIRAAMYLGERASVNDTGHSAGLYGFNELEDAARVAENPIRNQQNKNEVSIRSTEYHGWGSHNPFAELFKAKWGGYSPEVTVSQFLTTPRKSGITNYIYYPYFESKIEDLAGKGYNIGPCETWNNL